MNIEFKISKKPVIYAKAIRFLEKRVEKVKNGGREFIWILEHPTTFTGGVRFSKNEIIDKSISVKKTHRGCKITLHNPGQKIIYFVIDLNKRKRDIRKLINSIEKSIIQFLKTYLETIDNIRPRDISEMIQKYYLSPDKSSLFVR